MSQGDGAARSRAKTLMARFFLAAYEGEGLVSRKQAESLLYTLFAMSAATLIISFVMTDTVAGAAIFGIAVRFGRLALPRQDRPREPRERGTTFLLLSVSFAALPFLEPYDAPLRDLPQNRAPGLRPHDHRDHRPGQMAIASASWSSRSPPSPSISSLASSRQAILRRTSTTS